LTDEGRGPTWEDFGGSQERREALVESAVFVHLFHPAMVTDPAGDPRPFWQLGAAIMLDKPIILMLDPADEPTLPAHLRRVADRIVFGNRSQPEAWAAALTEAIDSLSPED